MAVTRRQVANSPATEADPATAVFGQVPLSGSWLTAVLTQRAGTSHAAHTMPAGWLKRLGRDVLLADASFRRTLSVWTRLAGASEPTSVSGDDGTANAKRLMLMEFSGSAGEVFGYLDGATNDNGAVSNGTSIASGNTPSLADRNMLLVGVAFYKKSSTTNWGTVSWTNGLGTNSQVNGGTNGQSLATAFGVTAAGGVKSTTASWTGGANSGLVGAVLAISTDAGGGGGPPAAPSAMLSVFD